jgi:predicted phosphodiesterase
LVFPGKVESFARFKKEVQLIRKENPRRRNLVMMHHAPTLMKSSHPPQDDGKAAGWSGFQNNMLGGEGVPGLLAGDVWVFGHTHLGYKFTQGEEACISNVMGALRNPANVEKTGCGKYTRISGSQQDGPPVG